MRTILRHGGRGPVILMLQISCTLCTLTRRSVSLEFALARSSMVRGRPPPPPSHPPTRTHPVRSIIPGIVIVLFFRCMAALLKPIHLRGDGVKWGLVSYTVVMFLLATVFTATSLTVQSNSYIDNRGLGVVYENGPWVPYFYGPFEYESTTCPRVFGFTPGLMFFFNYWLADGLLVSSPFRGVFTHSDV